MTRCTCGAETPPHDRKRANDNDRRLAGHVKPRRDHQTPSYWFGQLRRSLKRYRAGKIDGDTLAKNVDMFLEWDAGR